MQQRHRWYRIKLNSSVSRESWQRKRQDLKFMRLEMKGSEFDQSEIIRGSKLKTVGGQQIMHKHQVKSAAVDDNMQAPTGNISHHYEEDGSAKSKSAMKNNENTEELSQMMCSLLCHQSAPNMEIETSTENPLDYYYFKSVFKEAVEYEIDDPWKIGITFVIQ